MIIEEASANNCNPKRAFPCLHTDCGFSCRAALSCPLPLSYQLQSTGETRDRPLSLSRGPCAAASLAALSLRQELQVILCHTCVLTWPTAFPCTMWEQRTFLGMNQLLAGALPAPIQATLDVFLLCRIPLAFLSYQERFTLLKLISCQQPYPFSV